jgi:hypothetical protein
MLLAIPNAVRSGESSMKTSFLHLSFALLSLAGAPATVNAHDVDPYEDGWITHVDDHRLEICYRSAPPTVGDTVKILRTSFITPNKGPVREQFSAGGTAHVTTAPTADGCLTAELIEGSAKRSDHARAVPMG